jgi:hypothetical protein
MILFVYSSVVASMNGYREFQKTVHRLGTLFNFTYTKHRTDVFSRYAQLVLRHLPIFVVQVFVLQFFF